ncbi:Uncharacterised protein [Sphingobacterium spiritivorum]|uniref:Uncharacterized protein n=1 Tax=Sphingobacterium spiritivorum TaxID=258 RepID=A0A380BMP0_SPHSI|nr:Uncharacterised protein [Sphingobacterium spiritivorum]
MKAIHNAGSGNDRGRLVVVNIIKSKNESNSQPAAEKEKVIKGCCKYH